MKVDSINANSKINAYKAQKQYSKSEPINKVPKDKVLISEDAKYLNKISKDKENINLDKINEIKNRIKLGTYSVDSRDLAEKIIKSIKGE